MQIHKYIYYHHKSVLTSYDINSYDKKTCNDPVKIKKMMIGIKRPAKGIDPIDIDKVIGKITSNKIRQDQPIKWSDLN